MSGTPTVDVDSCVGCGSCVGACPMELFEMKDDKAMFKIDKKDECTHCETCIGACPASAISMK